MTLPRQRIAILGGGPGGYEAALVAAQLGADVTVVDSDGLGGACVLTDCVPSKSLIETSNAMTLLNRSSGLGIASGGLHTVNAVRLYQRITDLARAQSRDITARVAAEGIRVISGHGRLDGPGRVVAGDEEIRADAILIATGAMPRILPGAEPDGERILTWRQLYDLTELPPDLIVVGSGVTGAEFASAYQALGSRVTLVSSRDRVLPQEDEDAANLIEDVFRRSGMTVLGRSRAKAVTRDREHRHRDPDRRPDGDRQPLPDDRGHGPADRGLRPRRGRGEGGRARLHRGGPGSQDLGARRVRGGRLHRRAHAGVGGRHAGPGRDVARAGRVGAPDPARPCGRDHLHRPGDRHRRGLAAGGRRGEVPARTQKLPLATNPRAKMAGFREGFVKLFTSPGTGVILGGVIVAPRASELILAVSVAMEQRLTAEQLAQTFAVYPSLSGSVTEAARKLMEFTD